VDTRFSITENLKTSKNRYSVEFKKEAARLIIIDGMSVSEASKRLGVSAAQLYKWRDAHLEALAGESDAQGLASPKEMAAELDSLRKELRKAERVNEILKKR
jgi:transposase